MPESPHPPFRAEHIGSLHRPHYLVEAMERKLKGEIGQDELQPIQDRAIDEVVKLQEDIGLRSVTDGEFRRRNYYDSFYSAGLGIKSAPEAGAAMKLEHRLHWDRPVHADDLRYLASKVTRAMPKVTLLGPCRVHYTTGRRGISRDAYPDLDLFWDDVVRCFRSEIRALAEAGCRYIQIDETALAKAGDVRAAQRLAERGESWDELIPMYIGVLNRVVADAPSGMTFGIHMCRGNFAGNEPGYQVASGGYDVIAERMFNELNIGIFFLEYDSPRAGDFSPLRYLPKGKTAVLGLVTTKTASLESADDLKRRLDEAARHTDIDRLAISPQCGFSSNFRGGHPVTHAEQVAKLKRIVEVARAVWGTA